MPERPQKCPLCGGNIDPSTGICSVCGIKLLDRPEPERKEEPWEIFLKLPGVDEEFARALTTAGFTSMNDLARGKVEDIEKALGMDSNLAERVHEEAKSQAIFLCSNCGAFLSPDAAVCPFCGAIVYSDDDEGGEEEDDDNEAEKKTAPELSGSSLYLCPSCGAFISPDSLSCPHCGAIFEGEEDLSAGDEEEEKPSPMEDTDDFEEIQETEPERVPQKAKQRSREEDRKAREDEEKINQELLEKLRTFEEAETPSEKNAVTEEDISLLSEIDKTAEPAHAVPLGGDLVVCGNCGAIIPSGELFCPKCGVELIYGEKAPVETGPGSDEIMRFFGVEGADLSRYKSEEGESGALYICSNCGAFYPEEAERCPVCGTLVSEMERKIPNYEEMLSFDMFPQEEGVSICDVCGAFVPADRDSCPVCGANMEEHRYIPAAIPATGDDYEADVERFFGPLRDLIQEEKKEEEGELYICRVCGAFMAKDATECPVCGAKYGEEGGDFNICPLCGAKIPVNMTTCPICHTPIGAEIAEQGVEELGILEKIGENEPGPEVNEVISGDVIDRFMKTVEEGEAFFADNRPETPESPENLLVFAEEEGTEEGEKADMGTEGEEFEELNWEDIVEELDRLEAVEDEGETEEMGVQTASDGDAERQEESGDVFEETAEEEENAPALTESTPESVEDFLVYEETEGRGGGDENEDLELPAPDKAGLSEFEEAPEDEIPEMPEEFDDVFMEEEKGLESELSIEEEREKEALTKEEAEAEEAESLGMEETDEFVPAEPEEPVDIVHEDESSTKEEIAVEEPDMETIYEGAAELEEEESGHGEEAEYGEYEISEEEADEEFGEYDIYDKEAEEEREEYEEIGKTPQKAAAKAPSGQQPRPLRSARPSGQTRKTVHDDGMRKNAVKKRSRSGRNYMNAREGLLFVSLLPTIILLFIYDFLPDNHILYLSIAFFFALFTVVGTVLILIPGERGHPAWMDTAVLVLSGVLASVFVLKWYLVSNPESYGTIDTLITLGAGGLGVYAGSRVKGRGYFLAWLIGSLFMTVFAFMHIFSGPWDGMTTKIAGGVGLAYMMGGGILLVRLKWEELLMHSTLKSGDDSYLEKDYGRAVRAYEKVIRMSEPENNPDYDIPWYSKGAALISLGRFEEAIECLDRAIEINPMNEVTWNNKGNALSRLGRHREAIDCYDRALKINPNYEVAWNNKGNAYARIGRLEDALKCYDRAIVINEDYREAWINKGYVLVKLGMYDEAVKCANRIIPDRLRGHRTANA